MGDKHIPQIKENQPGDEKPHWGMCLLEAAGIVAGSHAEVVADAWNSHRRDFTSPATAQLAMTVRGHDTLMEDAYS